MGKVPYITLCKKKKKLARNGLDLNVKAETVKLGGNTGEYL